ncbi:MAG: hypothetical protein ABEJ67_05145 [Halanaeroarchaeum sp.]
MPETKNLGATRFTYAGGSAVSLAAGTLLTVTSVRDFLLFLDGYDLGIVGTLDSLVGVVSLVFLGSFLIVGGLWGTISLAVNDGSDRTSR